MIDSTGGAALDRRLTGREFLFATGIGCGYPAPAVACGLGRGLTSDALERGRR